MRLRDPVPGLELCLLAGALGEEGRNIPGIQSSWFLQPRSDEEKASEERRRVKG